MTHVPIPLDSISLDDSERSYYVELGPTSCLNSVSNSAVWRKRPKMGSEDHFFENAKHLRDVTAIILHYLSLTVVYRGRGGSRGGPQKGPFFGPFLGVLHGAHRVRVKRFFLTKCRLGRSHYLPGFTSQTPPFCFLFCWYSLIHVLKCYVVTRGLAGIGASEVRDEWHTCTRHNKLVCHKALSVGSRMGEVHLSNLERITKQRKQEVGGGKTS